MTLGSYSILDAALTLEKRRGRGQQQQQQESNNDPKTETSATLGPVDVVAIVSGVATLQSPPASSISATPRVDLRIADQSIPKDMTAKVSLYGSQEVARISEEQIAPGDVIRFNRIGLSRRHPSRTANQTIARGGADRFGSTPGASKASISLLLEGNNTIHFEHRSDDPEPGWRWCKLGRIRTLYSEDQYEYHERNNPNAERKAFLSEDERQSRNFPEEMATAESRIQELISWFASWGREDDGDISPGAEGAIRSTRTKGAAPGGTLRSLSPLPCKRRSLAEIQASSGILSNIHVRVTHCDSQVLPPSCSTTSPAAKKRRVGTVKSAQQQQQQVIGFATVADDSGVVLSLVDPGNRFESFFRTAQNEGKVLMMSNILSKKQSDIYGRPLATEEVVLWPTRNSSASILSNSSSDCDEKPPMGAQAPERSQLRAPNDGQYGKSAATTKRMINSRSQGGNVAEENTETQLTQKHPTFHNGDSKAYRMVESRVVDISINQRSLRQWINGTPQNLKDAVMSADGKDYVPAIVHLEPNGGVPPGVEKAKSTNAFFAGPSILQALCGGIAPSEWNVNNDVALDGGSTTGSKTPPAVGWEVLQFMRTIFLDSIPLRWTIDISSDPPQVIKVSLPRV